MSLDSLSQPNLYRGPSSSREFNERNRTIRSDINRAYKQLNQNEATIEKNMDIALRENFFLQSSVQELQGEVERLKRLLQEEVETPRGESHNVLLEHFYRSEHTRNGEEGREAYFDREHGVVTPLPVNTTSKLSYETEDGHVYLPKGLKVYLKEALNTERNAAGELQYYDVHSEEKEHIVDRKDDTFWVREVSFQTKDSVTEVFGEVHIKLPTEHVTNLYANVLSIKPYPEGSMKIRDIQYKGHGNQWNRLENYPTEIIDGEEVPVTIQNARKQLFQFNRTEMTELRIFYSQPYWFENEGYSTFAYGFQGIDLKYRIYTEKSSEMITKVDISGKGGNLTSVDEPEVLPAAGTPTNLTNLVEHHLYYDEAMEEEFDFNTDILTPIDKVYVKTILRKQGDTVPALKEIRIPHTYTEA